MNLQQLIKENERLFEERFRNLNDSTSEGGYDAKEYVKDFLHTSQLSLIDEIKKMVVETKEGIISEMNGRGLVEPLLDDLLANLQVK